MGENYLNWCVMEGAQKEEFGKTHGFGNGKTKDENAEE